MFYLNRLIDKSQVSGTGIVAEGVVFSNGKCVMTWLSEHPSVTIYDSIDEVDKIHGHDGLTQILFADEVDNTSQNNLSEIVQLIGKPLNLNRLAQLIDPQRYGITPQYE
jgi:hypothetical protein